MSPLLAAAALEPGEALDIGVRLAVRAPSANVTGADASFFCPVPM